MGCGTSAPPPDMQPQPGQLQTFNMQCGACGHTFHAQGAPGYLFTCPACQRKVQAPGGPQPQPAVSSQASKKSVASEQTVDTAASGTSTASLSVISVCCGGCYQICKVQPSGTGLLQFPCPKCGQLNRITVTGGGEAAAAPKSCLKKKPFEYPPWWLERPEMGKSELCEVPSDVQSAIQKLIDDTWKDITTRDRGFQKVKKLKVVQVQHNANPKLWQNYMNARGEIMGKMQSTHNPIIQEKRAATAAVLDEIAPSSGGQPILGTTDGQVNEFLLFHGTKPSACEAICKSDFMVNLAGSSTGTLYGNGIYFGENSSKSDEYASESQSGIFQGMYAMLLCRVTCGRVLHTEEVNPDKDMLVKKCTGPDAEYDSVLGDRAAAKGTYREFVVYNNDLAYPAYVIIYKRES